LKSNERTKLVRLLDEIFSPEKHFKWFSRLNVQDRVKLPTLPKERLASQATAGVWFLKSINLAALK
jgi:hypothetical protein